MQVIPKSLSLPSKFESSNLVVATIKGVDEKILLYIASWSMA